MKNQKLILEKELPEIQQNIPLAQYTTFQIGGRGKYFFEVKTKEEVIETILVAKKFHLPFFVLGGGSNVLVSDKGYKGLIIKIQNTKYEILNTKIVAEAGTLLGKLVNASVGGGLVGLEWAAGIPGTVGGAIYGNAGAFGSSMADIVKIVEVVDTQSFQFPISNFQFPNKFKIPNSKIKIFKNKDCKFKYRDSIFKHKKNLIILSVVLQLKKSNRKEIQKKIKEYLNYRKKTQPLNLPSAGSVFKNPRGFSAGQLIEKCGLKGKRIGNAKISEKHTNFIINLGGASAKDVIKLIKLVKEKVKKKFKIDLKEEIQYLGF